MNRPHTHAGHHYKPHQPNPIPQTGQPTTNRTHQLTQTGQTSQTSSEVVRAVQQLVLSVVRQISSEEEEEGDEEEEGKVRKRLQQLPFTDDNFHHYALVQQLEALILSSLPPSLEEGSSLSLSAGDGMKDMADLATQAVLQSLEYNEHLENFTEEVKSAVTEMLSNPSLLTSSPSPSHLPHPHHVTPSHSQATQYFSLDASMNSDLFSLLQQTGLMSPQQLVTIATNLSPSQPLEVQIDAMHHLLQFPAGDLVAMETWPEIRPSISRLLLAEENTVADLSLSLHSHLFFSSSSSSSSCRDAFLSLSSQLSLFFTEHYGGVVTMMMGVDIADDRSLKILQRINLLNNFQREVTRYWVRYNGRVVEELVDATFELLSLGYDTPIILSPIHFLSLVDPTALWFQGWMHGHFSRTLVQRALKEKPSFLCGVVTHLMSCKVRNHGNTSSTHPTTHTSGFYNESSLHYFHLSHSISLLTHLLLHHTSHSLFPVNVARKKVSISDVLVHLLNILYALPSGHAHLTSDPTSPSHFPMCLSSAHLIIQLFRELVAGSTCTAALVATIPVLDALLRPIKSLLQKEGVVCEVATTTLEWVGQVVASLAASDSGRGFLLHSPSLNAVTQFVVLSLSSDTHPIKPVVMATWLFVCRQLYKVGEGLVAMEAYRLQHHIVNRLRKLGLMEVKGQVDGHGFSLGTCLVDNLLNSCWAPRGILLLISAGGQEGSDGGGGGREVLELCLHHMFRQIRKKAQVSWCDRYGYGCLVAQLSTTPAGAKGLKTCGVVPKLIQDLWEIVEGGGDGGGGGGEGVRGERWRDARLIAPCTHPLDHTHHLLHKALTALLNVLSFPMICELLATPTSCDTTPTAPPTTFLQLINRLVLIDSIHKRQALLGYQDSHLVGMRVISMATTSLDSLLLLQERTRFLDSLFTLQREERREEGSLLLDACSLERNRILVACYLVGGASERILPPHYLTKPNEEYPWSLFTDYPPPPCYYGNAHWETAIDKNWNLYQRLSPDYTQSHDQTRDQEEAWLRGVRGAFWEEIKRRRTLPNNLVALLLERYLEVQSRHSSSFPPLTLPPSPITTCTEQGLLSQGAEMVVRYGIFLGLLTPSTPTSLLPVLTSLLTSTRALLTSHHHPSHPTQQDSLCNSDYHGFDWLTSSLFLLSHGNIRTVQQLQQHLSTLPVSMYIWPARVHLSSELPPSIAYSGLSPLSFITAHLIEMILQAEVPQVFSAFQLSGCTPSQICLHWLRQCFWNYLDWPEVLLYLATCIVMGTDYQVYYCVSVLCSLQPLILSHTHQHDLMVYLMEERLTDYHCADWLDYMKQLHSCYGNIVLPAMGKLQ